MDKVPKLGRIITEEVGRDAVHIAVAPVTAGESLAPGTRIGFTGDSFVVGKDAKIIVGIVDPFLQEKAVMKDERFYMFLLPNTITSLRHEWTHPVFEEEEELAKMQPVVNRLRGNVKEVEWVTNFALSIGSTYEEIMDAASDYLLSGDYLVRGGLFEGVSVPDEFWNKYEVIKGRSVEGGDRGTFLSCSC